MVTEKQIVQNYERFMKLLESDSRFEQLQTMYKDFEEQLTIAPASSKTYYHNCFPGGYLDHILRVYDLAIQQAKILKDNGIKFNFTGEELKFAALHHDLGKLGFSDSEPYYMDEESDWHRARGKMYGINENVQYMNTTDRGLYALQKYGIKMTLNEYLSIKLADGLFNAGNGEYLEKTQYPYQMHSVLPYIIHWADYMASVIERQINRF